MANTFLFAARTLPKLSCHDSYDFKHRRCFRLKQETLDMDMRNEFVDTLEGHQCMLSTR